MKINLHIEKLLVHDLNLSSLNSSDLAQHMCTELQNSLKGQVLSARLQQSGEIPKLVGSDIGVSITRNATNLGQQLAHSLSAGLGFVRENKV